MMKKSMSIISISILFILGLFCLIIICFNAGFENYIGWKTVQIENIGSFKVPKDWVVKQDVNIIYITGELSENNNDKIQLLGSIWEVGENSDHFPPYKLLEDAKYVQHIKSINYSNSAGYRIEEFNISGNIKPCYTINFWCNPKKVEFIECSGLLDEKTVKKIAKSYRLAE